MKDNDVRSKTERWSIKSILGTFMSAPLRIRPPTRKSVANGDGGLKPYLDRLLKLIPAEVLSLYLVGFGVIPKESATAALVWAVFCLFAVGLVKGYGTSDRAHNLKPDWIHVTLSMIAFIIWIYSMGGPFVSWGWHVPYISSLLILAFTFVVPYFYRGQTESSG